MSGRRVARIILTLVFVGLIASPVIMKRLAARREVAQANADARSSLARHGFYLQEVSEASGINFVHQSPALDPKLERIMPEVASMGAGVSIVDFDRDGFSDIYVTNSAIGSKNALYRNLEMVRSKTRRRNWVSQTLIRTARAFRWARSGVTTTTTVTTICFLSNGGAQNCSTTIEGHGFTHVTEQAGMPTWVQRQHCDLV